MLNFFFSPNGRITRWQFWQGTAAQLVLLGPGLLRLLHAAQTTIAIQTLLWAGLEGTVLLWVGAGQLSAQQSAPRPPFTVGNPLVAVARRRPVDVVAAQLLA